MLRNFALSAGGRQAARNICSVACLAFVMALAVVFWAGVLWIGAAIVRLATG
jgi:hypothetical protein